LACLEGHPFVFLLNPAFALAEVVAAKGGARDHFKLFWRGIHSSFMNQRKDIRGFQGMLAGQFVAHAKVVALKLHFILVLLPVGAVIAGCFHNFLF
jgi:hypothetical protein